MATKVLKLTFENSKGRKNSLTIQKPKNGLDEATVKAAMQKIADADVFEKEEISLYHKVVGAKYYTTDSEEIFTTEDKDAE